jgi:hypothetical protein
MVIHDVTEVHGEKIIELEWTVIHELPVTFDLVSYRQNRPTLIDDPFRRERPGVTANRKRPSAVMCAWRPRSTRFAVAG